MEPKKDCLECGLGHICYCPTYDRKLVQHIIEGVINQINNYHLPRLINVWRTMIADEIALAIKYMPKCGCKRKRDKDGK